MYGKCVQSIQDVYGIGDIVWLQHPQIIVKLWGEMCETYRITFSTCSTPDVKWTPTTRMETQLHNTQGHHCNALNGHNMIYEDDEDTEYKGKPGHQV